MCISNNEYYILNRNYNCIDKQEHYDYKLILPIKNINLFNDDCPPWCNDDCVVNLKNIINKFRKFTKNKLCINYNENTDKLMHLF